MSTENEVIVFYIGFNGCTESGIDKEVKSELPELTPCNIKAINKIYSGNSFTFYTSNDFTNIIVAGGNYTGACAIPINKGDNDNDTDILQFTPVTFFNDNNIKINKICVNPSADSSFFITSDDKLYGCGRNQNHQLSSSDSAEIHTPILVSGLENIIDVKSASSYNLALCSDNNSNLNVIITSWCRIYGTPEDVRNMIMMFCKSTKVYLTTGPQRWNEVKSLSDKNIIKISVGRFHSVCLSQSGEVYVAGDVRNGQLGLGSMIRESIEGL